MDKKNKYKGKGVKVDEEGHVILVRKKDIKKNESELKSLIKEANEHKINIKSEKILDYFTIKAKKYFKKMVDSDLIKLAKKQPNVDTKEIELKTMRLSVWLILKLIEFCSKRKEEKNLNENEMKYDLLISLLSYSAELTGIFRIKKLMGESTEEPKSCESIYNSFDRETQSGLYKKFDSFMEKVVELPTLLELYNDYHDMTNLKKKKNSKFYFDKVFEKSNKYSAKIASLIKDLKYKRNSKNKEADINKYLDFLDKYNKEIQKLSSENQKKWKKERNGENSMKYVFLKDEFWKDLLFGDNLILFQTKKGKKLKNKLKKLCNDEIKKLDDKFFTDKKFKYYSREVFKRYITLSMESWYINQNISGILKKCSEISGLLYSTIVTKVTPWQYNYESKENVGKHLYGKGFRLRKNIPILDSKQKNVCKIYDLEEWGTDINPTSYVGNLIEIEKYMKIILGGEFTEIHTEITDYLQSLYEPEPLFPIKTFPSEIEKSNKEINETINTLTGKNDVIDKQLKKWQKKKIDTVISVLMDPYVNKRGKSPINISDYKMFYVLSNNDTQLKCFDQLKTFSQFSKFISNMP